MYRIIDDNLQPSAPVSAAQMVQWITEGHIHAQTQVRAEGEPEWKALIEFPEFAGSLGAPGAPPAVPPNVAGTAPTAPPAPARMSGLAIASLVLGILGFCSGGLTAVVGLVLGILAMVKIRKSHGALRGFGLAVAGTAVSAVLMLLVPVMLGLFLPALAKAQTRATSVMCMNNLKQLALGAMMYAGDNKERFPAATNWADALKTYVGGSEKVFQCAQGAPGQRSHYAFNAALSGLEQSKLTAPAQTVLFFEIDGGWNASGGPELLLKQPRHGTSYGVVFADGHAEIASAPRLRQVRWEP